MGKSLLLLDVDIHGAYEFSRWQFLFGDIFTLSADYVALIEDERAAGHDFCRFRL